MTDINDVPQVNTLYQEQQNVQSAMDYLANGGSLSFVTVTPPAQQAPPTDPDNPMPPAMPLTMQMTVSIMLKQPVSPDLIAQAQIALQQRNDEINEELASLGVTGTRKGR